MSDVAVPQAGDRITLAGSDVSVPPLGVGTWAWGDKGTWGMGGYDSSYSEATIREAWEACIEAGVTLFDTAEVYGGGESERIIGRLLALDPSVRPRVTIATKFMPMPWKLAVTSALVRSAKASVGRLGIDAIDLYQIHGPISLRSHGALADALAAAHAEGLIKAIGVSNYSVKETRAMDAALRTRGLRLATNQIEFSLLRSMPEKVGLLACCRELGVVPLAYSPIGQGRLTGKFSVANPPPKARDFSAHPMEEVDKVVDGAAPHRRRTRGAHAEPGRTGLDHRQGRHPHPRRQKRQASPGQCRRAGMAHGRCRGGRTRRGRAVRHPDPQPTTLATRLS